MQNERRWYSSAVVGVIVGVFAGGLTILLLEAAGHRLFGSADPADFSSITPQMFIAVLVAWVAGCWIAGIVATAWSRTKSMVPGAVAGGVLLAGAVANMVAIPHPMWLVVAAVLLMPAAALLGARTRRAQRA